MSYKIHLKSLFVSIVLLLLFSVNISAQQFKRKGPNIGIQAGINRDIMFPESGNGFSYSVGITSRIFQVIYPAINFVSYHDNINYVDSSSNKINNKLRYSMLNFPVSLRLRFMNFSIGKTSGNRCTGINIFLISGLAFSHKLSSKGIILNTINDSFSFHAGLGFNVHRQGQNWLNQFTDIEYDLVYSRGFDKNISDGNTTHIGISSINFVIRMLMFKTYKFGNM